MTLLFSVWSAEWHSRSGMSEPKVSKVRLSSRATIASRRLGLLSGNSWPGVLKIAISISILLIDMHPNHDSGSHTGGRRAKEQSSADDGQRSHWWRDPCSRRVQMERWSHGEWANVESSGSSIWRGPMRQLRLQSNYLSFISSKMMHILMLLLIQDGNANCVRKQCKALTCKYKISEQTSCCPRCALNRAEVNIHYLATFIHQRGLKSTKYTSVLKLVVYN